MDRNERQRQARATAATETLEERDARLSQRREHKEGTSTESRNS